MLLSGFQPSKKEGGCTGSAGVSALKTIVQALVAPVGGQWGWAGVASKMPLC